jgi:alkane 1-monooxygenase
MISAMSIRFVIPFLLLALVPLGYRFAEAAPWLLLPGAFAAFAVLERVIGPDSGTARTASNSLAYRVPIWAYILAQIAVILWGIRQASQAAGFAGPLGLALATGATAGVFGMLAAHEMIHSRYRAERALGLAMLAATTYTHFRISHLYGHHRRAATPEDPATARRGESAYHFVLRSAFGQWAEAWHFEARRCRGKHRPLAGNRVHHYLAAALAVYGAIAAVFGWRGLGFEIVQSGVAVFVLELFNYVAHYGLVRQVSADGRLEAFAPHHSWNVAHRLDNSLLLNGGRHADHHRAPATPYQQLRPVENAPILPFGFAGSILLALVPPLWRRVMDPRIARRIVAVSRSPLKTGRL